MRDLVETALGVVLVACLWLVALLLPCALIDIAAGTTLLGSVTAALLLCFSAAAILGVVPSGKDATPTNRAIAHQKTKVLQTMEAPPTVPIKAIGAGVSRQAVASRCSPSGTPTDDSYHSLLLKK